MSFSGQSPFQVLQPPKAKQVSEPSTGYICGFEIYTGDASGQSQGNAQEL